MSFYTNIELKTKDRIATLWLNRPDVRNAFHHDMIAEIMDCLASLAEDAEVNVLLLRGHGKVFCAGADIQWMKSFAHFSTEEDYQENLHLAECFYQLYTFPKPTIAIVHGAAYGGANGLLAACDMAYCTADTTFAFSEVKLGIIPATIAPYVLKRTGEAYARELMLTGKRFTGDEASDKGLVNHCFISMEVMENYVRSVLNELRSSSPAAMTRCKELIRTLSQDDFQPTIEYTARMIAEARASKDGQEGMDAFIQKRKPDFQSG